MFAENIYTVTSPYREDMIIKGYSFGKGDEAACILGFGDHAYKLNISSTKSMTYPWIRKRK